MASVSVSTVDRVLNERGGVTPIKSRRVLEAAHSLGFGRTLPELWHATRRIEVILPRNATPFWYSLDSAFIKQAAALPRHYVLQRTHLRENDLSLWKRAILNPAAPRAALIIAADGGEEIAPTLNKVIERGEMVITLATEVPKLGKHLHSGIDNLAAGRTAGHLMTALLRGQGNIVVLPPHERRVEHRQRLEGFSQIVAGRFQIRTYLSDELSHKLPRFLSQVMDQENIIGIYDTGNDSSALGEMLKSRPERPVWIAHEKSETHQQYLKEGVLDFVLDQDPEGQVSQALYEIMQTDLTEGGHILQRRQPELRIYCRENL